MQNKTPADRTKTARRGIFIFSCCCTGICTAAGALFASLSAQKAASCPPPAYPQNPRSFPPIRKLFFQRRPDDHGNHFAPCAKSRKTCSYKAGFPVPPPWCSGARSGGKAALTQPRRTGQNFFAAYYVRARDARRASASASGSSSSTSPSRSMALVCQSRAVLSAVPILALIFAQLYPRT